MDTAPQRQPGPEAHDDFSGKIKSQAINVAGSFQTNLKSTSLSGGILVLLVPAPLTFLLSLCDPSP